MKVVEGVYEHHEETAIEFLESISPVFGLLANEKYIVNDFIYRGHSSIKYELLPTAFRDGTFLLERNKWFSIRKTNQQQIQAEIDTLIAFLNAADRQGHHIPEDSQDLRACLQELSEQTKKKGHVSWPDPKLLSLLGLAQHYGLPTRLLDWSLDPYIAAYFAAYSAAIRPKSNDRLCVWLFDKQFLRYDKFVYVEEEKRKKTPISFITVPTASNENLKAQKGVFLIYNQYDVLLSEQFTPLSYDKLLIQYSNFPNPNELPFLVKFTLPTSEAPELLKLLSDLGVNGSSVFPGLDGAVQSVLEMRFWPELGSDLKLNLNDRMMSKRKKMNEDLTKSDK